MPGLSGLYINFIKDRAKAGIVVYQEQGGLIMKIMKTLNFISLRNLSAIVTAVALAITLPAVVIAQTPAETANGPGKVLGIAFQGHQVSNLDQSIIFYEAIDFHLSGEPGDWQVDEAVNRLGGTPGAETRTAIMTIQSSVSDKPFTLILREYRGIERQNWGHLSSSDLLSGHIDITVQDDCNPWLEKLKAIDMLRIPEMNLAGGGSEGGPRRFVFVQDPDGWYIELFAIMPPAPGEPPPGPKVSNSTATFENIDRLGKQPGFNHIGLNVVDPVKALAFYQDVLGGDYPPFTPQPAVAGEAPRMNMLNGWFPQATRDGNLRFELIKFPQNEGKQPPPQRFADISVNYTGFQVADIDAVYARTKAAGAITVSDGGIVNVSDGRAVILRDPDVGGFVELWEPAK